MEGLLSVCAPSTPPKDRLPTPSIHFVTTWLPHEPHRQQWYGESRQCKQNVIKGQGNGGPCLPVHKETHMSNRFPAKLGEQLGNLEGKDSGSYLHPSLPATKKVPRSDSRDQHKPSRYFIAPTKWFVYSMTHCPSDLNSVARTWGKNIAQNCPKYTSNNPKENRIPMAAIFRCRS